MHADPAPLSPAVTPPPRTDTLRMQIGKSLANLPLSARPIEYDVLPPSSGRMSWNDGSATGASGSVTGSSSAHVLGATPTSGCDGRGSLRCVCVCVKPCVWLNGWLS